MRFTAAVSHEGAWHVARCLEVEVTSQAESFDEALVNLREALELYFEDQPKGSCSHDRSPPETPSGGFRRVRGASPRNKHQRNGGTGMGSFSRSQAPPPITAGI
jgi:predicted RNase H-like HicB family nuclease